MAFQPKIKLYHKNNNTELFIEDITGIFDANNNVGGWDNGSNTSGNPRLSDVDNATAIFTFSDGSTGQVNLKDAALPFPNYVGTAKKILASDFGKSSFVDGLTKVTLIYDGFFSVDPFEFWTAQSAAQDFLTMNVQCCVQKLYTKVDTTVDFCKNGNFKKADEADAFLKAIWNAAGNSFKGIPGCNQILKANQILKQLQTICTETGCSCGC